VRIIGPKERHGVEAAVSMRCFICMSISLLFSIAPSHKIFISRGQPVDYDGWDEYLGGAGWSYADVLPCMCSPTLFYFNLLILLYVYIF